MKVFLMFADRDFDVAAEEPANAADLVQDLELDTLWAAMAGADPVVLAAARAALLAPLPDPDRIRYRQAVLNDALHHSAVVRELYDLAGEAIAAEKSVFRSFFSVRPETLLAQSVRILEALIAVLRRLRRLADDHAHEFRSAGFGAFFDRVFAELDDGWFRAADTHLRRLAFKDGLLLSARLGGGNRGTDLVLRRPHEDNRTLLHRTAIKRPNYSFSIPDRDEAGFQALGDLRDRVLDDVANAAAQAADHVRSFFTALRDEVGFLVGCLTLADTLTGMGQPLSFPGPAAGGTALAVDDLREPCLALRTDGRTVGTTVRTGPAGLVVITGANRGGKSTFLRALGNAQLMMQAGMYVTAASFAAPAATAVFTHYKREEDTAMRSGKLDEELARMRTITDHVRAGGLLLCNESFAATNEREGADIAAGIVHALLDAGVRVAYVTHNYGLAHGLYEQHAGLFLRAGRESDGHRTYRLAPGAPLPTSYGHDLYERVFGPDAVPEPVPADPPAATA